MRNALLSTLLLLAFVSGAGSGCGSGGGKVAAVVNGTVITVKDVDDRLTALNPATRALFAGQKGRLLDQMVTESVLLQEANRRGLARNSEVRRLAREAERQIVVGKLLDDLRRERQPAVSDEQVASFYESNKENFKQPDTWRASHILVTEEADAKKALDRIKGGEPFAKVAQEVSIDPSKARGGDIGFFSKGQVIPEFEEAVLKLKPGEMSGILKTPLGYHIILLAEQKDAHVRSLEEVQEQVRQILQNQQGQQNVQQAVQELRSKARVKIEEKFSAPPVPAGEPVSAQKPAS